MSYEPQIAWLCPHKVANVSVTLDGTTATLPYPMAGNLGVHVDGREVPAAGLMHAAQLWSSLSEPYTRDQTEQLTVTTDAGTATFTFPARPLSAAEVCRIFNSNPLLQAKPSGRRYYLESRSLGSKSVVSCAGSAVSSLGFAQQRQSRGVDQYPGWALGRNAEGESRLLIFRESLPGDLKVTVSGRVVPSWCPRCQGTGVENDLRATQQGAVATVVDHDLLYQRCLKVILTRLGSNPYVSRYGTNLLDLIGRKHLSGLNQAVNEEVRNALTLMQSIDRQQAKIQALTLAERLGEVVRVNTSGNDPTVLRVDVEVRSLARQPVYLSVVFGVSGATSTQGKQTL